MIKQYRQDEVMKDFSEQRSKTVQAVQGLVADYFTQAEKIHAKYEALAELKADKEHLKMLKTHYISADTIWAYIRPTPTAYYDPEVK